MRDPPLTLAAAAKRLEEISDAAVVVGPDHRILAANAAYRTHFGLDADPVGRHCYEVSHRYDRPCDQMGEPCCLATAAANGEPCRTLHVHHTHRGALHEQVAVQPIVDAAGRRVAFLEVLSPSKLTGSGASREVLVGRSPAFNRMLELVHRVAATGTTVLLLGESGTGKELVAQALHELGGHSGGAFVPIECSGLSETLFESELFGHEKGAFTGAAQRKTGLVEAAEGGTLFLDEVGDIPLSQQVKLLRLLETGTFRRVGSVEQRRARFRLVCATHQDLREMVRVGRFRDDLYYRISAFPVELPPLRERPGDVPVLVEHLLARLGVGDRLRMAPETLSLLERHPFPGNVRELLNILERACLLADGELILPRHLPPEIAGTTAAALHPATEVIPSDRIVPLAELEERYLRSLAERFPGSRRELAARLGLGERTLYRRLAGLGVDTEG